MTFLLDEMFPPRTAAKLRRRGVDTLAAVEDPDLQGSSDAEILERAASQGRILVTENTRDFARLHVEWLAQNRSHTGIVFVSTKTYPFNRARLNKLVTAIEHTQQRPPASGQITFL